MNRFRTMRIVLPALLLAGCVPATVAPTRHQQQQYRQAQYRPAQYRPAEIVAPLLAAHNRERARFGSPPLAWDPYLAAGAAPYADQLAREGRLRHSPRAVRPGQGENLWIGTRGFFPLSAMIGSWTDERRLFRAGRFPDTSRTGRWSDVGHFTAIVWPTTTRVGCAIGQSARWEVLVCRYAPSGNIDGVAI